MADHDPHLAPTPSGRSLPRPGGPDREDPGHPAALARTLALGALRSPFKRPAAGVTAPPSRLVRPDVRVDPARLAAYARVCGFSGTGPLPLPYPHVLAFPLAMRLMAARAFPLPLLGLVHTWIEITRHRPLPPGERTELTVRVAGLAPHRRGTEATVVTEARVAGERVWESASGYLARHATRETAGRAAATARPDGTRPDVPLLPARAQWRLPHDLGRRYGGVSGDRNPIHLHPLTARLFGFPRPVAHGMWTLARCLAEQEPPARVHVRADFRAPVPLPGTVVHAAEGEAFQLRGDDGRIHVTGTVRGITAAAEAASSGGR
ncbi:MaoC/PaaZ C-terminal domain-containing protein [Streptomyces sp. SP18CS02]|uniref:MaoC/PaaZ C-terminal domain-containing protein n=1 Tax=Streptomyces sp. SP18CS02 TaxID=3002531 RepID=UPI002E799EF4|nr:MaoC/PaaZ C-terminal domain-containing protein [Streptomyces sp. SP18CS02]MEE1751846.1 MaoC/PaaZ C-terminal domain-containing protein [Streptomyces sp. SP18CS02]